VVSNKSNVQFNLSKPNYYKDSEVFSYNEKKLDFDRSSSLYTLGEEEDDYMSFSNKMYAVNDGSIKEIEVASVACKSRPITSGRESIDIRIEGEYSSV